MPEERGSTDVVKQSATAPLIFISHDSRDAELAEAFSNLLKRVSAGMLKSFRSSDKRGSEGIEFGDEWYKTLMGKLDSASDVVCLITERSLNRPWILYEAGVAKGKMDTPVHGLALGVSLSLAGVGPFYQFQNSDDTEDSLSKLVIQLCKRIPGLEPDIEVVTAQVQAFKAAESEALKSMGEVKKIEKKQALEDGAAAKVLEEMKLVVRDLPNMLEQRLYDSPPRFFNRKGRRFHPEALFEIEMMMGKSRPDGTALLVICGLLKDDFPWIHDLAVETYRTLRSGSASEKQNILKKFLDVSRMTFRGPLMDMLGGNREAFIYARELPMILEEHVHRILEQMSKKSSRAIEQEPSTPITDE